MMRTLFKNKPKNNETGIELTGLKVNNNIIEREIRLPVNLVTVAPLYGLGNLFSPPVSNFPNELALDNSPGRRVTT